VSSVAIRVFHFCLVGLALGVTSAVSTAQNQPDPGVEQAPLGTVVPVKADPVLVQQVFRGEFLYESKGYVFHKPVNFDREFFEFTPGQRGLAIFLKDKIVITVDLEFKLTMLSPTQHDVFYWIFTESRSKRLWAFQANSPSMYGYSIFVNDSGNPFSIRDWIVHDLSRRSPEW
jgi:hypothetical protein